MYDRITNRDGLETIQKELSDINHRGLYAQTFRDI